MVCGSLISETTAIAVPLGACLPGAAKTFCYAFKILTAMLPTSPSAALHPVNFRPLLRSIVLVLAAASCSVLPGPAVGVGLLVVLGLLLVLGVLGLRRENRAAPIPAAAFSRSQAQREPAGEIRCNPFFELLSSPSL